jgi:hypothetical protein
MRPMYALVLIVAVCCAASGLAADAKVSGKVNLNGKPLVEGEVIFHPEKGKAVSAKLAKDGTYSVARIPAGRYKICVKGKGVPDKFSEPAKTPLVAELKDGASKLDIELKK